MEHIESYSKEELLQRELGGMDERIKTLETGHTTLWSEVMLLKDKIAGMDKRLTILVVIIIGLSGFGAWPQVRELVVAMF